MKTVDEINRLIAVMETELAELDSRRSKLLVQVAKGKSGFVSVISSD